MGGSTSYIHLRFAALSFALACAIGLLAVFAARSVISDSEQGAAAASASRLFSAPMRSLFADASASGRLSAAQEEEARELAAAVVPSDALALRVFSTSGELLFSTDGGGGETAPSVPITIAGGFDSSISPPVFETTINDGPYVAQIVEDAAAIKSTIAERQRTVLYTTILAVGLLYLLLQGAFWLVVRGISSDHRRLVRLYVAGESLRATLDVEHVLTQLTRDATTTAGGQFGLVALYDHETGDLILRSTYEHATGAISHHQRSIEEWFMRRCVVTNTTIINAQSADAFQQLMPAVPSEGQVNVLCVPMTIRDHVVGVVTVLREPTHKKTVFARNDVRQVVDLGTQGAMAIEQAQLFAKVRTYAEQVELSYDSTLKALTAALDAKDDVTEGHCERVARLTSNLAIQLGIKDRALVDLERGALLHDVGKIGVPDEVLKKPSALNDMEWEAIRKHPLLAGVMISKVGFLEGSTPVLLYHHERYDGGGYPFGLSGDQIPLDARIFSVVDAYDAMTSNRPYRLAMSHREAMREISLHSGTQFDPAIVREFQRMMGARPELHSRGAAAEQPSARRRRQSAARGVSRLTFRQRAPRRLGPDGPRRLFGSVALQQPDMPEGAQRRALSIRRIPSGEPHHGRHADHFGIGQQPFDEERLLLLAVCRRARFCLTRRESCVRDHDRVVRKCSQLRVVVGRNVGGLVVRKAWIRADRRHVDERLEHRDQLPVGEVGFRRRQASLQVLVLKRECHQRLWRCRLHDRGSLLEERHVGLEILGLVMVVEVHFDAEGEVARFVIDCHVLCVHLESSPDLLVFEPLPLV